MPQDNTLKFGFKGFKIPGQYIVVLFLLLTSGSSFCQIPHWLRLTSPSGGRCTPYFLNENVGYVYDIHNVFRSTDGAQNWKNIFYTAGTINQIYFSSLSKGYIASSSGIWATNDSGITWSNIYPNANCPSVYATGNKVYVFVGSFNLGQFISSTTDGLKWDTIFTSKNQNVRPPSMRPYVFGNKDDAVYTEKLDAAGNFTLNYTFNNGLNWGANFLDPLTEGMFSFPHCLDLLRTNLGKSDTYPITYSGDFGGTWQVYLPSSEIGAWIAGNGCFLYVSNADARQTKGPMRSTDKGKSWVYIPGPNFTEIDDNDFHNLSIVGYGAVIYASDIGGGLWKSTDGGDGYLNSKGLEPLINISNNFPTTYTIKTCDNLQLYLTFKSNSCTYVNFDSLYIEGLEPAEYSVSSGNNHSYCVGSDGTVNIQIIPHYSGSRKLILHAFFKTDEFTQIERKYPLTLNVIPDPNSTLSFYSSSFHGSSPDTMSFKEKHLCSAGDKDSILLVGSGCEWIKVISVRFEADSLTKKDFTIQSSFINQTISAQSSGRITLNFQPKSPGLKKGIIIILTNKGNDTIPVFTNIIDDPPQLVITKKKAVDFGMKSLCIAHGNDSLTLFNPSCYQLRIKKISLVTDQNSINDFSISTAGPYLLRSDTIPHTIFIDFHPQTSGIKAGSVIIETDIGTDTIPVSANVLPDARILHTVCETMTAPMCDSVDGIVHLYNFSCRELDLISVAMQSPYRLLPSRFPIYILPGDSAILPIRFMPTSRGNNTISVKAKLIFSLPIGSEEFDTTLTLSGFATHGASAYALSSAVINLDTVRLCDSSKKHFSLYSIGCDSLPLTAISISGDADFSLSENGTRNIATGDSIGVNIKLDPISVGKKNAMVTITLADNSKVRIPVTATIIRAYRNLTCDANGTLDLGSHLTCADFDTTITVSNPGCDTIRVSGVGLKGSGFGTNTIFPVILLPGESKLIHLHTILDTTGGARSNIAALDLKSDADNTLTPLSLVRSYIFPHPVHLWLDADRAPLTSSKIWKLEVKARASELQGVSQIDFGLVYNTDLLVYSPTKSSLPYSDGKTFSISGSLVPKADSTIAELAFEVYMTKDTTTSMMLNSIILNGSDPDFMGCVAYVMSDGTTFNYLNGCGDADIRRFLTGKPMQFSIHPNPAQDKITLDLRSELAQNVYIEIRNALGAKVSSESRNVTTGSNSIYIDTKDISGGMYLIRVTSDAGVTSQSFVKVR